MRGVVRLVLPFMRSMQLAPQLRGRVEPRLLEHWRAAGWHVHRVGAAAYVHSPDSRHHLILGVWCRRSPAPSWAGRLGSASEGYLRRFDRLAREQRARTFVRDGRGRFVARLPWWQVPPPRVYSWDPEPVVILRLERLEVEAHNRAIRIRRGLHREPTELELRAEWGDR